MGAAKPTVVLKEAILRPQHFAKDIFTSPLSLTLLPTQKWAITGTHKSVMLQVLAGQFTAVPAASRTYPFLEQSVWPATVTSLVAFDTNIKPAYLAARYESFREVEDADLESFLRRAFHASPTDVEAVARQEKVFETVVTRLGLEGMLKQWVVTLSNGQNRRARIARGLLKSPRLLLADEPFLGLDPTATATLSDMLNELAPNPHVILGLRAHEPMPEWITHVAVVDETGLVDSGTKAEVAETLKALTEKRNSIYIRNKFNFKAAGMIPPERKGVTSIIDMDHVNIQYQDRLVIQDLKWVVRRGEKWHLQGNNGSGKSTLLSMLTADHPQSWNSKVKIFDEPRKVGKQNYFSINRVIGHASPEIHAIFPKTLTARQAVATGFTIGSFLPPSGSAHIAGTLTKEQREARVQQFLDYFSVKGETVFADLSLNDQKLVLFMRAIVKNPEILVLDEAFSGMNDRSILLCKQFVDDWGGTVIAIGHVADEIPRCDKYIRLFGKGQAPDLGLVKYEE
ncbi:P-loop containing nucleoside triphosphate hydrolase protein [Limtongia smithiae]|uniref:P-loop containing nucleoside triphosphate hydrolase protein n=1 Tax=Limtongia smithiae TaxID=1125753 RepID=UPI0034CD7E42